MVRPNTRAGGGQNECWHSRHRCADRKSGSGCFDEKFSSGERQTATEAKVSFGGELATMK